MELDKSRRLVGIALRRPAKVEMLIGAECNDIAGGNLNHVVSAEQIPALALFAVFLCRITCGDCDFVAPRVALARKPEKIRHIAVCDELLRSIEPEDSVLDCNLNLCGVIQTFRAVGHAEFGLDGLEDFLNVGNGASGVVEVNDLLRFHRPGPLGGCHINYCGVLIGHLLTGKKVDERVRKPYEVTVSRALRQFADGSMADLRERVIPVAKDGLCLRGSGGGEKVCDALQNIAQRLRGYGVFGLQLAKLGNELRK